VIAEIAQWPKLLLCHGTQDTRASRATDYDSITWPEICQRAAAPSEVPKSSADAFIPSTYRRSDGRNHGAQLDRGEFHALVCDIDDGGHGIEVVEAAVRQAIRGSEFLVYSTASANLDYPKWRVIIPLLNPVSGNEYPGVVSWLMSKLRDAAIACDEAMQRTGQIAFLPNVPPEGRSADGTPIFYRYRYCAGPFFDAQEISAAHHEDEAHFEKLRLSANKSKAARRLSFYRGSGESPIDLFCRAHQIEDLLQKYGYKHDGKRNWRSPHQRSGSYATRVFDDAWVSLSQSDAEAGLGAIPNSGIGRFGDAFDLYVHFEHSGDQDAALKSLQLEEERRVSARAPDLQHLEQVRRREEQRRQTIEIGSTVPTTNTAELVTLEQALGRFVFCTDGKRVVDRARPHIDLALTDFEAAFEASKELVGNKQRRVTKLWAEHPNRLTVTSRTFAPGRPEFTTDPRGVDCINSWTPIIRSGRSPLYDEDCARFVEHIHYLFGDRAEEFLDFLAHIEQRPGVLPHHAWLHISARTGTGRNWIAATLVRLWRGCVAMGFDLGNLMNSGFNGILAGKLLAIVDEVREGARETEWKQAETLKRLITEEERQINPKYGRQHIEFNACRWLMFSNHTSALPLEETDRRFEVYRFDGEPRSEAYYAELYRLVEEPDFINDIGVMLRERDISSFNPGRHARMNDAKRAVIDVNKHEATRYAEIIRDCWPCDILPASILADALDPDSNGRMTSLARRAAAEAGIISLGITIHVQGKNQRAYVVRHYDRWLSRTPAECATEARRGVPDSNGEWSDYRDYLDGLQRLTPAVAE
jgi:hypothetical protein